MHLLIDNYGVKIEVEDGRFMLSAGEEIRYASALKLSSICILKPCSITSAALELAAENQVPVMILDETGEVTAWLWSPRYGTIAEVRIRQAFFSKTTEALKWMQKIIGIKILEQANLLLWLSERVQAHENNLQNATAAIKSHQSALPHTTTMKQLMGLEAIASKKYWEALSLAMTKYITIPGRIKRGATDPFNACLNYLYGILYGQVETSLLMAGADPYMGFMHVNQYAKPALAFDHIEAFRPWMDKMLIQLFMQHPGLATCMLVMEEEALPRINSEARKLLLNTYFQFMEQKTYLAGKRVKNKDHIHHLSARLVKTLKKFNRHDPQITYL